MHIVIVIAYCLQLHTYSLVTCSLNREDGDPQSLRSNMVSPVVIIIHYVTFKAELSPVVSP